MAGDAANDGRAADRRVLDPKNAPDAVGAIGHDLYAESTWLRARAGGGASVVHYLESKGIGTRQQFQDDVLAARMFDGVMHGLLRNPIKV